MSNSKNVWLHGSYYGLNFGDLLLVDQLRKRIEERNVNVCLPFSAISSLKSMDNRRGWPTLLSRPDRIVFSGGGYFGQPGKNINNWNKRFILRHGPALWACNKIAKKPPVAIGIGFGPIDAINIRKLAVDNLNKAEICYFRDEESFDYFKKYGGSTSDTTRVKVTTDMALSIKLDSQCPDEVSKIKNQNYKVGLIHLVDEYKDKNYIEFIINSIINILKDNKEEWVFKVILDGKGRRRTPTKQDITANVLVEKARRNGIEIGKIVFNSYVETMSYLAHADFVLTSKLHVGIVSSVFSRNICAIPYHSKTVRFYNQIGEGWRCLTEEINEKNVYEHISEVLRHSKGVEIPQKIIDKVEINNNAISII